MSSLFIGTGTLLIIFAILAKIGGSTLKSNLRHLKDSDPDKIIDMVQLCHTAHFSLGEGNFAMTFEGQTRITADKTCLSPLGKTPCIYYKAQIHRLIGKAKIKEKVFEKEEFTDFYVEDDTGKILVQYRDLKEPLQKMAKSDFDEFRQSFREFDLPAPQNHEAVVGYQLQEHIIPIGQPLYIYGQATDRNGELMLARFLQGDQPFIISDLSKREYVSALQKEVKSIDYGVPLMFFTGLALIIYGYFG
jgi:hypothetical protein